ncbi:MAG: hypothetical protein LUC45_07215 [Paraprevotella sp.]|nr:hypothetical protein [Paraprevotella sp.]
MDSGSRGVVFYLVIRNNSMSEVGLIILCFGLAILLADQFSSSFCKPYFARFRSAQDPQLMYLVDVVDGYRGGRYGFISSHAANTFAVCIFLSLGSVSPSVSDQRPPSL